MHSRTRKGLIYSIVQVALRTTPITVYHSRQITVSEKMLIIATRWNGKLYLLVRTATSLELTVRTIIMLVTQNVLIWH